MRIRFCLLYFLVLTTVPVKAMQEPGQSPDILKEKAETFLSAGLWDSAVFWYNNAAATYLSRKNVKEYLICKNQESFALSKNNKITEALKIVENALDEYPDSLSFYKLDIYFYWKKSLFNYRLANFPDAFRFGNLAKETATLYGTFNGSMRNEIMEILITSSRYLGLYDIGLDHAFEKLAWSEREKDSLNISHSYNSIGLLYKRLQDFERAREYFLKSTDIRKRVAPEWAPYVMQNIAEMYHENKNHDSALLWNHKTLVELNSTASKLNLLHSALYGRMAYIYAEKGQKDSSLFYIEKGLEIRSKYEEKSSGFYNKYLKNKAEILIYANEFETAEEILSSIRPVYFSDSSSPQQKSSWYSTSAWLLSTKGNLNDAIQEYHYAELMLCRDFNDEDLFKLPPKSDFFYGKEKLLETINKKIKLFIKIYEENGDKHYLRAAIDHSHYAAWLIESMIRNQSGLISISGLYQENREIFEAGIRSSFLMNEIAPDELTLSQLSNFMESSRMNYSRMLYEFNKMIEHDGITDSIRIKKVLLEKEINALEGEIKQNSPIDKDKLFKLKQEFDQLNFQSKNKKNELRSISPSLQDIQKKLKRSQVLIQYYFVEDQLYCLASTRNNKQLLILPWGDNERNNLEELQKALRDPGQLKNAMEYGIKVYRSLDLDNLTKNNPKELIIIPDKELHYLPFDALTAPDGDFLIEKYTIYYKNSLFFFDNPKIGGKMGASVLGMAPFSEQIANDRVFAERGSPDPRGSYLPGSADEVDYIHKLFGGKIKHGEFATEAFFRENSSKTGVIHLATHAQIDDSNPLYNTFVFAPNSYAITDDKNDDGLLHTHELYSMNFNSDLVTLSACNSGIGKFYDGEGVMSLASAFRIAGANNIVMSLWSLPDDATSSVMRDFYSQLDRSVKKASALRQAKLKYLENADMNSRSPYFWAATVYIGDNTVLFNRNKTIQYLFLAFLVFIIAGGIVLSISAKHLPKWLMKKKCREIKSSGENN